MSHDGTRLTAALEAHPRLAGALISTLTLLSLGASAVAANSGAHVGP